jgi:hypothetical protein
MSAASEAQNVCVTDADGIFSTGAKHKKLVIHKGNASILMYENTTLLIQNKDGGLKASAALNTALAISGKAEIIITEKYEVNDLTLSAGTYVLQADKKILTVLEGKFEKDNMIFEHKGKYEVREKIKFMPEIEQGSDLLMQNLFIIPDTGYINTGITDIFDLRKNMVEKALEIPLLMDMFLPDISCGCAEGGNSGIMQMQNPDSIPEIEHKK